MTKRAYLQSHTVDTDDGLVGGYLVRATGSGKTLGYVWAGGEGYRWRAADPRHFGERVTREAAVEVLCDIAAVRGHQGVPLEVRVPVVRRTSVPTPTPTPKPARQIVWTNTARVDLTAAIAASLKREKR